jgi:hypothetical protein
MIGTSMSRPLTVATAALLSIPNRSTHGRHSSSKLLETVVNESVAHCAQDARSRFAHQGAGKQSEGVKGLRRKSAVVQPATRL